MSFDYALKRVKDGRWGGIVNGSWNGLVAGILSEKGSAAARQLQMSLKFRGIAILRLCLDFKLILKIV